MRERVECHLPYHFDSFVSVATSPLFSGHSSVTTHFRFIPDPTVVYFF